ELRAFLLGSHPRVGTDSPIRWLPKDLLRLIVDTVKSAPSSCSSSSSCSCSLLLLGPLLPLLRFSCSSAFRVHLTLALRPDSQPPHPANMIFWESPDYFGPGVVELRRWETASYYLPDADWADRCQLVPSSVLLR